MAGGFRRRDLESRYDVVSIQEDAWHSYSGRRSAELIRQCIGSDRTGSLRNLLNAGSGVYGLSLTGWRETALDLFVSPLLNRSDVVCGSVESLPFREASFEAVVCVGEVLSYCDPARAISEFSRVLRPTGRLMIDFGSSTSSRLWFRRSYGRAADIISTEYNGSPERTWVYAPEYIGSLLRNARFTEVARYGTHSWAALIQRISKSQRFGLELGRRLGRLPFPAGAADLMTILAVRDGIY